MLDIRRIRTEPEAVKAALARRGIDTSEIDQVVQLDQRQRALGSRYGILDNERAVKISGAMFSMQRRGGAPLARALCQLALDRNADAYEEVRPPSLVLTETLTATGQLPKFADDAYAVERDDL